ncbi:hypothetical protein GGI03_005263, partial [Coemansia sp. RSA 2337]
MAARELAGVIATDLEARLLIAAKRKKLNTCYWDFTYTSDHRGKGRDNDPHGKGPDNEPWMERPTNYPLDAWAPDILEWTGFPVADASDDCQHSDDSEFSDDSDLTAECTDFDSVDFVNPMDFAHRQAAPASHLIVADAEIARTKDDCDEAELRLATRTNMLYFNQHNRRFAWGLTASNRTIRSYVFGPDNIWQSTEMDITSAEGRQVLISLLVDWSLCSVDSLGFDPSIRYVVDRKVGDPYLEIDVHKVGESTGKVGHCTYYSKRCFGTAERLTGHHARYFAASTTPESMDTPAFLLKDVWTTTSSGSAGDTREISFLKALRDAFGGTDKFKDSFSHFVSTGPVYVNREGKPVLDSTATAFAGLPSTAQGETKDSCNDQGSSTSRIQGSSTSRFQSSSSSRVRQHRRTVLRWPGNMISAADNPSQVVIAIADAM